MIVPTKNPALVGAAIGRPSVKIRSDRKQNASVVKISTISPVGLTQKRYASFLMRIGRAPSTGRAMLAPTKLWFIAIFHLNSGDIPTASAVHNRADAIQMPAIFSADQKSSLSRGNFFRGSAAFRIVQTSEVPG